MSRADSKNACRFLFSCGLAPFVGWMVLQACLARAEDFLTPGPVGRITDFLVGEELPELPDFGGDFMVRKNALRIWMKGRNLVMC